MPFSFTIRMLKDAFKIGRTILAHSIHNNNTMGGELHKGGVAELRDLKSGEERCRHAAL